MNPRVLSGFLFALTTVFAGLAIVCAVAIAQGHPERSALIGFFVQGALSAFGIGWCWWLITKAQRP